MNAQKFTGALSGLLMLSMALTGTLVGLAAFAPSVAAHEDCYSSTPDGCGDCTGPEAHSHYMTGPAPLPWCYYEPPGDIEVPCIGRTCLNLDDFRLADN